MKTIEQHFADWESNAFGYGYGSGEEHVLGVLKSFLAALPATGSYDYEVLESAVSAPVAWLLINALAHDDHIEYGGSPRYGWLTPSGKALAEFISGRTLEQVVGATDQGDDYVHCYPEHCNCDDGEGDCRPLNPFWPKRRITF